MTPHIPTELEADARTRREALLAALAIVSPEISRVASGRDDLTCALAFSDFVFMEGVRFPEVIANLLSSGDLDRSYATEVFARRLDRYFPVTGISTNDNETASLEAFDRALRSFRRREMLRIAIRDLWGRTDLSETLTELSGLADAVLQRASDFHYRRAVDLWGEPKDKSGALMLPVVLGLGKLGAHELNFSSDVDLMFAYAAEGTTSGGRRGATSHEDFFTRTSRELIRSIGAHTSDGFVFRVDARLRPFGESGPLTMSFDRLEDYYQEQGREWERYALIKARPVAGDLTAGQRLITRLRPFIYRRYLDYGVFDGLREMKARIAGEVRNRNLADDIKLGPGGIREIEFFGQMFQLIRGGVEPTLQRRPIRQVLAVLAQKGFIPEEVARTLDEGYIFLRRVENRLQEWADQQTHQLPIEEDRRLRLAAAMGFADWPTFSAALDAIRDKVQNHFAALLSPSQATSAAANGRQSETWLQSLTLDEPEMDGERAAKALRELGYTDPSKVLQLIQDLHDERRLQSLSASGRQRMRRLLPLVLKAVGRSEAPEEALDRVFELIKSIQQRTAYLALLVEKPAVLDHLVSLTGASPWISSFLNRHPVLLDELLDPRTLYRPPLRQTLDEELIRRLGEIDPNDLEYQMEALRVFKQINVLRVAASDITQVLPLMKVSDHLSDIAESVVTAVVSLCWQQLTHKYGRPTPHTSTLDPNRGFAVIAYGKLGGLELGYGSDLDLVFLHAAEPGCTTGAPRSIDCGLFFSRLGQRVLHFLTTHTPAGILYEADMRLRPSGDSGMLVCHIDAFRQYQQADAWSWEHQALIRARTVVGDQHLRHRFEEIRREVLTQPRNPDQLRRAVADMRERLRKEHPTPHADLFDIKHGTGGIIDIEFLVQYLVLCHAHRHPEIVRWTDNVRLLQSLMESGILDETTAFGLRRAYLIYRAVAHRLSLREQESRAIDDRFGVARNFVVTVWNRFLA